jgi:hypothetical protein
MRSDARVPTSLELKEIGIHLVIRPGLTETKLHSKFVNKETIPLALRAKAAVGAGIAPPSNRELRFFSRSFRTVLEQASFVATWGPEVLPEEATLLNSLSSKKRTFSAANLDPVSRPDLFASEDNWLLSLQGKSVLVISPFSGSIEHQVPKLSKLHSAFRMPEMDVTTWAPPVSNGLSSWAQPFSARLAEAREELDSIVSSDKIDVALISAGAYGPLLAGFLFDKGVSSIHVGGCLQLLFGVMGGRWRQSKNVLEAVNQHWLDSPLERPPRGARLIEGATYW